MPDTTPKLGLQYLKPSDPPDLSGGLYDLARTVEAALTQGTWSPGLGGSGNPSLGSGGGSDGTYLKIGAHWFLTGRLLFGSSATFGTGVAVITNLPFTFQETTTGGEGVLTSGSAEAGFRFTPFGGNNTLIIRFEKGTSLGYAFDYGTPPQSSQLRFRLRGTAA